MFRTIRLVLIFWGFGPSAIAENILLIDGRVIEGRVVSVNDREVVIHSGFEDLTIPRSDFSKPELDAFSEATKAFQNGQFEKSLDLCQQILIWEPDRSEVQAHRKKSRQKEMERLIRSFGWREPFSESLSRLRIMVSEQDLPRLHDQLENHGNPRGRRAMAWLLGTLASEKSVEPLLAAIENDDHAHVRRIAAHALGWIRSPASTEGLAQAMTSDENVYVKMRAADSLNWIGTRQALAEIRKAIRLKSAPDITGHLETLAKNPRYRITKRPQISPGRVSECFFKGTRYLLYCPKKRDVLRTRTRLVISVHGTGGGPGRYVDWLRKDADEHGVFILAPHFSYGQISNFGVLNIEFGRLRADLRILEIIDDLAKRLPFDENGLMLFGHSEGGQFVNRFVAAHPDRVWRAAACGVGGYVFPDPKKRFPIGIKVNPFAPDLADLDFGLLVQTQLAIVLGTNDSEHHQEVAKRFMDAVAQYAERHRIPNRVKFLPVTGGGHSGLSNYPTASQFLYGPDDPILN